MKNPKQICRECNLHSYQAFKGGEVVAATIRRDVAAILTTPSDKTIYEQLKTYFKLSQKHY